MVSNFRFINFMTGRINIDCSSRFLPRYYYYYLPLMNMYRTYSMLLKILPFILCTIYKYCQYRLCKADNAYLTYAVLQRQLTHLNGCKLDHRQIQASYISWRVKSNWTRRHRKHRYSVTAQLPPWDVAFMSVGGVVI
jgi:hypothetical protein